MDNSSLQRRDLSGAATRRSFRKSFFALLLGAGYGLFCAGQAGALPGTPTIQNPGTPASNATFASTATTLTVTQLVSNLAIVWTPPTVGPPSARKAFDILTGETVTFLQPSTTAVAYNSISCPGCSATIIAGTLQSRLSSNPSLQGGRVWLFDPNGIVIGQGAVINVGGFIASSLQGDIPTWLANPNNPLQLTDGGGATPTNGAVTNDGNITASDGVNGYVALIGNSVAATHTGTTGAIDVGFGSINLAAGRVATITALNTGGLNFALSGAVGDAINVNNGTATSAVLNSGALTGAAVTLSANVAAALFTNAVNTSGVIRAVNLDNSGGTIKLVGAGAPIVASNSLDASGTIAADPVGTVQITGDSVSLGTTTVNGALTVEATTGGIAQTGPITAGAATFTTDTADQTVALAGPGNTFTGAVSLNTNGAAGTATIEAGALNLGTSNVGGALTSTSATGDITESGVLTAATGSSFTSAGNINLGTQANALPGSTFNFTSSTGNLAWREAGDIAIPTLTVPGSITLISDTGLIAQAASTTITATAGNFTTSAADKTITVGNTGNTFTGAVTLHTTGTGTATIEAAALNLGASTVGGTLTATSETGDITESGVLSAATGSSFVSAGNINLGTQANVLPAPTFTFNGTTGNLALRDAGPIAVTTVTVPGSITLISDTGTIAQNAATTITAGAGTFTTSAANQNITVENAGNTFTGAVSLNTAGTGSAAIESDVALNLGTSNVGGLLFATPVTGGITESGIITAGSGTFITQAADQNINLATQANSFTGAVTLTTQGTGTAAIQSNVLNLGTSNVGGALSAKSVTGDITESGILTAGTGSSFNSAGNINLGTQANVLPAPTFTFSGATGNLTLREAGAIAMSTTTVPGSITLISDTLAITQNAGTTITATAGNFTTSAADQNITVGNAGNVFTGPVTLNTTGIGTATIEAAALNLGTSNVGGAITATSTSGDITESGLLTAGTGSLFSSAGNINLGTQANVLPAPTFVFTGTTGNLALREFGAIAMPAITVPGSITLISDNGAITQTGAINATAGSFTTSGITQDITLGNTGNTFSGTVTLNTNLAGTGSATIYDTVALNLGTSSVGGTLTAASLTGDITESGVLTALAPTGSSFSSGGSINLLTNLNNLHNPGFIFTGATGNLGYQDVGSIALPATNLNGGNIALISGGAITQTGPISAGTGAFTTSGAQTITLADVGNIFNGAVTLTTGTGAATIEAAALNFAASNVGGALTATSLAGDITESGVVNAGTGSAFTSSGNINLATSANTLHNPTFTFAGASGNLGYQDTGPINMTTTSLNGNITLISGGAITQSGAITADAGNFTTSGVSTITLANAGNAFSGPVTLNTSTGAATIDSATLDLGTSHVGGLLTGTATAGALSQTGALTAAGGNFTATGAQTITLTNAGNTFSAPVSLHTGTGAASIEAATLNLGTSSVGGPLTATSTTGAITESGVLTDASASTSTFTSASSIDLSTQTNLLTGPVALNSAGNAAITSTSLNFATSHVVGVLTGTATTGGLIQSGALTAGGGNFTTLGSQTIVLGSAGNTFSGPVSLQTGAGSATIEAAALNLGASTVGGLLTATTTTGDITESGALIDLFGSNFISARNIDLSTQPNQLTNPIFTTGTTGNLGLREVSGINLNSTTVNGSITLVSDTGSITQKAGTTITAGAGNFTTSAANQNITLGNLGNAFSGAVSLHTTGTGSATIEAAVLNLGASTVGGPLTAMSTTGAITESGALTDASASSFTSATTIDLSTQANSLTGTVALNSVGNAAVTSTSLNFAASNVGGVLTGAATTGALSQIGALTAAGGNFTTSGTQTISLTNASNVFSGPVSLNTGTGAATIQAAALNLGTSTVGGPLTASTTTGAITESGVLTDASASSFNSATTIDLSTQANNLTGTIAFNSAGDAAVTSTSLNFAASNVGGVLTGTATTGALSQIGALTAGGGNFTTSGAQTISLTNASNAFSGAVSLNTGTGAATIQAAALNLGTSTVGGPLTATSTTGAITESGVLTDASASTFASATTIDLSTSTNNLTGTVALSSAGNAAVMSTSLNLAASSIGGALTGTTTAGDITESGVLTTLAPGSVFTSAGNIDLSTQPNALQASTFVFKGTSGNLGLREVNAIAMPATTVPGSITLVSDTGAITQSGPISATSGTFTTSGTQSILLVDAGNLFSGPVTLNTGTGAATIEAATLNLGASTVGGVLSGTALTGGLTESGVLTAAGANFTAGNAGINLATQANNFSGPVQLTTSGTGAAAISSQNLNLGTSNVGGPLTASSTVGDITQSGVITDAAASSFTSAGNIDLSTSTNALTGPVALMSTAGNAAITSTQLNFAASTVAGTLTATSTVGDITESGILDPTASHFTSAGNINLATQANVLPNATFTFTGATGNLGLREVASIAMPAIAVPGSITLISDTGSITQTGAITATTGSFTTSAANQAITLGTAGNVFTGAVSLNTAGTGAATILAGALNLGASTVGGPLTATSTTGAITESGVLTDASGSSFTSATSIDLSSAANALGGVVVLNSAGTAAISSSSLNFGASKVGGALTATATTGGITQSGVLTTAGGSFSATAANQSINLGTQTNNFTGAVSLNTKGTGTAAVKGTALNLGASTVGGTLAATATTGNITESGVLTATGGSTFTSTAGNIDLSTSTNVLGGTVVAAATNGFVNVKATQFAAVDAVAKNDITLNATAGAMDHLTALTFAGNVTADATGAMTLDGVDAGLTSATGNVTLSAGGSISQTFAYNATAHTGLTSNDISIRGNTVTLTAPNLGSAGNFVGIIANNLTTANSTPGNLYFAVLTPSGQKIPPANLKINGLSALPVTPGVFLAVGNSLPQTEFNIGSPAYLSFVKTYESAPTFDLSAGQVETSAESLASALNVAANSQQGTSSVNGILGSTPDANISLFNIVGVCLPADQRDDEEAAKQKDCVPAKSTDNRSPKLNPLSDALSSILVASRSVGSAAAQELR